MPETEGGFARLCSCQRQIGIDARKERSGIEQISLKTQTFDTFRATTVAQKEIAAKALKFAHEARHDWIYLCGQPGAGKTHLCTAICNVLFDRGFGIKKLAWRREAVKLKALVNDADRYEDEIVKFINADVLFIDDFLKGKAGSLPTDADVNLAFALLDARYAMKKLTIISSERGMKEMLGIDEAIATRIYEMCHGQYYLPITDKTMNHRIYRDDQDPIDWQSIYEV